MHPIYSIDVNFKSQAYRLTRRVSRKENLIFNETVKDKIAATNVAIINANDIKRFIVVAKSCCVSRGRMFEVMGVLIILASFWSVNALMRMETFTLNYVSGGKIAWEVGKWLISDVNFLYYGESIKNSHFFNSHKLWIENNLARRMDVSVLSISHNLMASIYLKEHTAIRVGREHV